MLTQVTTIVDPQSRVTTLFYNAQGLVSRADDPFGRSAHFSYDTNNNLVSALFEEHRIAIRLEEMSPHLVNAVY